MSRRKPFQCSLCHKSYGTPGAVAQHARDYHKTRAAEVAAVPRKPRTDDGEESYADRAIQAHVDRLAGIHNPDDCLLPPP